MIIERSGAGGAVGTGRAVETVGIYIHFPYCSRRCPYCDFTVTVKSVEHDVYLAGVLAELQARAPDFEGRHVVSIYFGGGTPGLWRPDCIGAVIDAIGRRFTVEADAEVTVECNPGEVDTAHLLGLRVSGVNRISLGCQSFDDAWLAVLGRTHDAVASAGAIEAVQRVGFARFSVDVMHGMQGQSIEAACADVQRAVDLGARHISTYQLTIEPRTVFGARANRGETLLADEDALLAMFTRVRDTLQAGGVPPYEVSSAAASGHEAVHNRLYWNDTEYLALGVGAHGYRHLPGGRGLRWSNPKGIPAWHAAAIAGAPLDAEHRIVDVDERLEDRVMCGLRLDAGIVVDAVIDARFGQAAQVLAGRGLMTIGGGRWAATDRGRLMLDRVVLELVSLGE